VPDFILHFQCCTINIVTATLVAKESAKQSTDGVQDAVGQALIVGLLMAMFGSTLLLSKTEYVLSSVLHGEYMFCFI
jgi:xanthine/uracil/vitamin C permease (AzgA family)